MLMIVMHNRLNFIESLFTLANKEGLTNSSIIERKGMGAYIYGGGGSFVFHDARLSMEYDKAFVAVIKDRDKAKHLLDLVENDDTLKLLNLGDRAFVCTLPFQQIKHLEGREKKEEVMMKIKDYLREDRILLSLKTRNKEEAIEEIATVLKDTKEIIDFDTFIGDVFKRETVKTTGIGNETAIPHARSDAVKDLVIAFGRSQKGVEFNSVDDRPAKLIFLMGTSKNKNRLDDYLQILARLTRLLQNESFRNSLLKASSPKEIINIFQEAEV